MFFTICDKYNRISEHKASCLIVDLLCCEKPRKLLAHFLTKANSWLTKVH
jgi:hypothetical protein